VPSWPLSFAAAYSGGRLVFFLPATPEAYHEEELPVHPVLQMVENTEQPLTSRYSRRLITMVKVARLDEAATTEFKQFRSSFSTGLDQISEQVYSKIEPQSEDGREQGDGKGMQPGKKKFRGKVC
jgi:hypothetical protein